MSSQHVTEYNHLIHRVKYPLERGYRMEEKLLPDWIYITITEENNSKYVTVYSSIHVNKKVIVGCSYSTDFTNNEIIKDQSANIHSRFLA